MKVGQLCSRDVVTAPYGMPILEAAREMRDRHVGDVVVVEMNDEGEARPVGVLTDRDLVVALLAKGLPHLETLEVGDVMSRDLVTATEDEGIEEVLRRMRKFAVRRIPVVTKNQRLVGLLAVDDLLGALSDELATLASLVSRQRTLEQERRP